MFPPAYQGGSTAAGAYVPLPSPVHRAGRVPLEKLPLLVRAGAGLPLSERITYVNAAKEDRRELRLFPLKGVGATRGDYIPAWKTLKVTLPEGEKRKLLIDGVEGSEWVF